MRVEYVFKYIGEYCSWDRLLFYGEDSINFIFKVVFQRFLGECVNLERVYVVRSLEIIQ